MRLKIYVGTFHAAICLMSEAYYHYTERVREKQVENRATYHGSKKQATLADRPEPFGGNPSRNTPKKSEGVSVKTVWVGSICPLQNRRWWNCS